MDGLLGQLFSQIMLNRIADGGEKGAAAADFMARQQAREQEETDRRWRNMSYYSEENKDKLLTMGDFDDMMMDFGLQPNRRVPNSKRSSKGHFGDYMKLYGSAGQTCVPGRYKNARMPDAPAKCDKCKVLGAQMRCSGCGERYCSQDCFSSDWRNHKSVCNAMAEARMQPAHRTPPPLWTIEEYSNWLQTGARPGSSSSRPQSAKPAASDAAAAAGQQQRPADGAGADGAANVAGADGAANGGGANSEAQAPAAGSASDWLEGTAYAAAYAAKQQGGKKKAARARGKK